MKFNSNYFIALGLLLIIFICLFLGNYYSEGFTSGNDIALTVQEQGQNEAKKMNKEFNKVVNDSGLPSNYDTCDDGFEWCSTSQPPQCVPKKGGFCPNPSSTSKTSSNSKIIGNNTDSHGCNASAGEVWCESLQICTKPWEQKCPSSSQKTKNKIIGGKTDKHGCNASAGEVWCDSYQICIKPWEQKCPSPTSKKSKNKDKKYCGKGTIWDKVKQMCTLDPSGNKKSKSSSHSDSDSDSDSDSKSDSNFFEKTKQLIEKEFQSLTNNNIHQQNQSELDKNYNYKNNYNSYNDMNNKNDMNMNDMNNLPGSNYVLKSEIVPPVCPACPPVKACASDNKKCPPCPAPEPVQPCPPCARCPEPAFDCKKVPNYNSTNKDYLPRPLLNDFSNFSK